MINKKILTTVFVLVIFSLVLFLIYTKKTNNDSTVVNKRVTLVSGKAMLNVENCKTTVESEKYISIPYKGAGMSIRAGNKNDFNKEIVATLESDVNGNFEVYLNPGEYCVVFNDKVEKQEMEEGNNQVIRFDKDGNYYLATLDVACDEERRSTCDIVLNVPKDGLSDVVITKDAPCVDKCEN